MDILLNTENRKVINLLINYLEKQNDLHLKSVEDSYNVEVLDYGFLYKIKDDLLKYVYVSDLFDLFVDVGSLKADVKNRLIIFNEKSAV